MSTRPLISIVRRTAAVLAAAAATLTVAAGSASAYEPCPRGWWQPTRGQVGNIVQLCEGSTYLESIPFMPTTKFFVKVRASHVSQGFWPIGEPEHNGQFAKNSVEDALALSRERDPAYALAINGTFFNDTSSESTSSVSFPFWSRTPGWVDELQAVGNDPATEGLAPYRTCISWRRGASLAPVKASSWSLRSDDWSDVWNYAQTAGCSVSSDDLDDADEMVVAITPIYEVDWNRPNSVTFVGRTSIGLGGTGKNGLCLYVGGWQTRAEAMRVMEDEFGCEPVLQLDGGNSSQLSYWDPVKEQYRTPVTGYDIFQANRPVPHVLLVK